MKYPIQNIGILAHVDAGKTTITEQILFKSGALRTAGSVDKGTSITDSLKVERDRGISVRLATASFIYKNIKINLIDTPGHVDFCAEVEYSLRALDAVILVVSAVEGVQGHTISLYRAIKHLQIPCVIFINKIDRIGADVNAVMADIHQVLTPNCLIIQQAINEGNNHATILPLWSEDKWFREIKKEKEKGKKGRQTQTEKIIEQIVEFDDELLELYLDGNPLDFSRLDKVLKKSVKHCNLIPVVMGVAKNAIGIIELLDVVIKYLPHAKGCESKALSAMIFKIEHDKTLGKMSYLRVFDGVIYPRDVLPNASRNLQKPQKVGQLKAMQAGKYIDVEQLSAGDIGVASGLSHAQVGDIYGVADNIPDIFSLSSPMLTVQVKPVNEAQIMDLVQAFKQLSDEDPMLDMQWLNQLRELHIRITGMIQIEILQTIIQDRFNLATEFSQPSVIYKETPAKTAYGYERYWMPKPCWAILKLKIEPTELGSGVTYESQVSVNNVAAKYQKEIAENISKALSQGIKGWQVTDLKITLVEGEDHNVHSRSGDFIIATPMAIMNGLQIADTILLEPILSFLISASIDLLGTITSDITKMRGTYESPQIYKDNFILKGKVPAATSMKYPITLASISAGKAKFTSTFHAYKPCTDEQGQTTAYRGVSPLERDKWILQARGAL
ncbi:MAG: TetM/TetW/TetO/TetS family tetracycline resistance ribosomal protection protein [Alcanivoracaceae bacterium]|nr:TetM/TetW/TetO/TetS family tetracycline resistance ribosomal protection protein [Alcanivoracaceae bacterium]